MLRLLILRHAKAVSYAHGGDFERPLNERGRREAALLGAYIRDKALRPDAALVSPAQRTRETLDLVAAALGGAPATTLDPDLYNADAPEIVARVAATPATTTTLLLIGHNPGLAEIAVGLSGSGAKALRAAMERHFPPASLAVVAFGYAAWADIAPASGTLEAFVTPETLAAR
jgi:phosphohistidine phosphatase